MSNYSRGRGPINGSSERPEYRVSNVRYLLNAELSSELLQTNPNFLPEPVREFAEDMTARNLDLRNGLIDDGIKITRESCRNWRDRNERSKSSQDRAYDEHRAAMKHAVEQREKEEADKKKLFSDNSGKNRKRERDAEQEERTLSIRRALSGMRS
jgi:hypothetical protein